MVKSGDVTICWEWGCAYMVVGCDYGLLLYMVKNGDVTIWSRGGIENMSIYGREFVFVYIIFQLLAWFLRHLSRKSLFTHFVGLLNNSSCRIVLSYPSINFSY